MTTDSLHRRRFPFSELKWIALGIALFLFAAFTVVSPALGRDVKVTGFCAIAGLFLIVWKIWSFFGFVLTPRSLVLDAAGLTAGRRSVRYDAIESLQLVHESDRLILRHDGGRKLVIRLNFWNDADAIHDRLVLEVAARLAPGLQRRLAAEGRLAFGKVTLLEGRLEYKGWVLPYAEITNMRTQSESGYGSVMEYLVISAKGGRSCKIDRSTIVNEPLLLEFLSQRLPA